jgi:predicted RNA-binding protein YlqC (UPF0109 family)
MAEQQQPPAQAADAEVEDDEELEDEEDEDELEPDLKGLVEYVAKALVDKPTAVKVDEVQDGNTTVYELEVDEEDIGKVIGRQGRVVRGLRALVKAAATRKGIRVDLDVV